MSQTVASVKELTDLRDALRDGAARRAAEGHKCLASAWAPVASPRAR